MKLAYRTIQLIAGLAVASGYAAHASQPALVVAEPPAGSTGDVREKAVAPADTPPTPRLPNIALTGAFTQFVGASIAGDGSHTVRYGGRDDLYATVALTNRLSVLVHPEVIYGKSSNSIGGNTLLPVNTAMLFPNNNDEGFDLSVSVTQKIGSKASLTFGKINLLDLAAKTPLIGGGGLDGFQNIALAAPPSGLVPPSLFGAILSVPTKAAILSFWVYDPISTTNRTGFEHTFAHGVAGLVSATVPVTINGKPGFQNLKVSANTKTGFDLTQLPELLLPPGSTFISSRKGAWNVTYSFQQYLWMNPAHPRSGWGIFGQISRSDGNPTPLDWSGFIGLTGNIVAKRPNDQIGVAYFRQSFSNALTSAISPLVDLASEQGVEAFYTAQFGKHFRLTADAQIIDPALQGKRTAVVLGLRLKSSL